MPRKRIHELAKEWEMDTRQLLAKLEELGIHGKKAQSILTDQEIALVRPGTVSAIADPPSLVLGEEKLIAERVVTAVDEKSEQVITAREEVTENRLSSTIIRRRVKREVIREEEAPVNEPAIVETEAMAPAALEPEVIPPPLSFELPVVEPAALVSDTLSEVVLPVEPPPEPVAACPPQEEEPPSVESIGVVETPAQMAVPIETPPSVAEEPQLEVPVIVGTSTAAQEELVPPPIVTQRREGPYPTPTRPSAPPRVEARSATTVAQPTPPSVSIAEPPRPPRVLGRIDLGVPAAQSRPRPPAVRSRPQPPVPSPGPVASRDTAVVEVSEVPAGAGKRPKQRIVIRKPDTVQSQDRDL